jgi:hypothetical protein
MVIEDYGNVSTFAVAGSNDTMTTSLLVSGTTVGSSQSVTTNNGLVLSGQTMTAAVGTIASAVDASTPDSKLIVSGSTSDLAAYKLTTTNDNYTLTEAVVSFASAAAASNITSVELKDGATVLATAPVVLSGSDYLATFSGLSLLVPANTDKVLTVAATIGDINTNSGSAGAAMTATLTSFKANNSQGTETSDTTYRAGNAIYVYKSIPTVTPQTLPSTVLTAGTQTLAKFSVSSDSNPIGWKKFIFTVNKSASSTITNVKLYDGNGVEVLGTPTLATVGSGDTAGTISFVPTTEESISGSKTYTLKADIGGVIADNDYISTSIGSASMAYAAPADYATVAATNATFVWSDQNKASHSLTTTDWFNNFLVKNIPTDSQTLTR